VNASTASRLLCYGDYASGLMAPTSGTNTTFGGTRHEQDQSPVNGAAGARPGHHDRVSGRSKSRMRRLQGGPPVTRNRSFPALGWRSRQ
jgi:hypothetical protein